MNCMLIYRELAELLRMIVLVGPQPLHQDVDSQTMPMMITDAFMALKKMSDNPQIDVNRAGLTGWSLGGGVALFTAWEPIQQLISPKLKLH